MKVLIACEESQRVCSEFRRVGAEAYSCDIKSCGGSHPEWHIHGDALSIINGNCTFETEDGCSHQISGTWDLLIAHPPCTYLSCAGARHLFPRGVLNEERYKKGLEGKAFFFQFYNSNAKHIAVENPKPLKIFEMPEPSCITSPHYFGASVKKKTTYLWLKNLPPLSPTEIVTDATPTDKSFWFNAPRAFDGLDRQTRRSRTHPRLAKAMAEQWYRYLIKETSNV